MYILDYSMIVIYMAVVIGIGIYFSRNEKSSEDYLLGGRNMPYIAIGISCMMSILSSVSIVVVPGEIFNNGLTLFSLSSTIGILLAIPAYLLFIRFYFKLGSFTPYQYLEYRYNAAVRTLIAVSALYTRVLYLGTVLFTSSKIFEGAYGWPTWQTIILVGVIGAIYTVLGGMKAVVWSDVLQFVVLFIGFTVVVIILCVNIEGGAWGAVSYAFANGRGLHHYASADFYKISPYIRLSFWILLFGAIIGPFTNACSDQIAIQRFLSTKNWKEGFKSQIISTSIGFISILILMFVGLALYTYYANSNDPGIKNADGIFFHFIVKNLPSPMPGIFMAAMLAAIMSTLDSGMNSMATVWLKEIHEKYIDKNMDNAKQVKVSRWATLIIGLIAIVLGVLLDTSGKWLTQSAAEIGVLFTIFSAVILPAFLFAVLSPRANSMLIWFLAVYSIGDVIVRKIWYAMSRSTVQNWTEGNPLGWAGPISLWYFVTPLVLGVILIALWKILKQQKVKKIFLLTSAFFFGISQGMLPWFIFSNIYITDKPMAVSFAFYLPLTLLVGFIALRLCPKQARKEYQGLTIGTINEPIIKKLES